MNLVAVTLPPVKSSAVKSDIQSLSKEEAERLMAWPKQRDHGCQREKAWEDLLLHLPIRCKHGLHRRLRLESVHVDNPFDAVHP